MQSTARLVAKNYLLCKNQVLDAASNGTREELIALATSRCIFFPRTKDGTCDRVMTFPLALDGVRSGADFCAGGNCSGSELRRNKRLALTMFCCVL